MAANPSFIGTPNGGTPVSLTAAVTSPDGIGAATILTAGPNGTWVDRVKAIPKGTNASATVLRIFKNNGVTSFLVAEITCPATAVSQVAAQIPLVIPLQFSLPTGWALLAAIGTTIAAGIAVSAENCGDF